MWSISIEPGASSYALCLIVNNMVMADHQFCGGLITNKYKLIDIIIRFRLAFIVC